MKMAPPILYYWSASPPARACMLTVKYLNLDVNIQQQEYTVHQGADYGTKNPDRKIPILDDDGFFVPESIAICRYLIESKAPERAEELLGKTPKERAIINHRLFFHLGTLFQKCFNVVRPVFFGGENVVPQSRKEEVHKAFEVLDTLLREYPYAAGEHVTLADLVILPTITSLKLLVGGLSKYPAIAGWYDKLKTLPGYAENEEGGQLHIALFKGRLAEPY